MIYDKYGRPLDSLRIQVNAVCNFKCFFCHMEGTDENADFLTAEEIEKVVEMAAKNGVNRIKFTGGEPLMRKDILEIISRTRKHIDGDISLTTNAFFLPRLARQLKEAGLNRINISMHSLDEHGFQFITGVNALEIVRDGVDAALDAGLRPVKVNFVVLKGINNEQVDDMIEFTSKKGAILQLIEYETDRAGEESETYKKYHFDIRTIEEKIKPQAFRIEHNTLHNRSRYSIVRNGKAAEIEFVAPQRNADFCNHCTRLRVTARGEFQTCLNRRDRFFSFRGKDNIFEIFEEAVNSRVPYWGAEDDNFS